MCGMFNRPRKTKKNSYKTIKNFRSNDIGTYLGMLKIGTNKVVINDILNEKFLKSHSHFLVKFIFIA